MTYRDADFIDSNYIARSVLPWISYTTMGNLCYCIMHWISSRSKYLTKFFLTTLTKWNAKSTSNNAIFHIYKIGSSGQLRIKLFSCFQSCLLIRCNWMVLGCVSLMFRELSKIFSRNLFITKIIFFMIISNWNLYVCPKPCFRHTYKISTWNSQHKCYFLHCIFSGDYFGELAKR